MSKGYILILLYFGLLYRKASYQLWFVYWRTQADLHRVRKHTQWRHILVAHDKPSDKRSAADPPDLTLGKRGERSYISILTIFCMQFAR